MQPPLASASSDREECATYGALAAIGAIPVVIAVAQGVPFGAEATIGLMMSIVGIGGLVARWRIRIPESAD